jgi:hypothetical protein
MENKNKIPSQAVLIKRTKNHLMEAIPYLNGRGLEKVVDTLYELERMIRILDLCSMLEEQ